MATFIIEKNIDEYIQQLKIKPMQELRNILEVQSYNEKRWKLQSEFRKKLDNILTNGNEICFLWKDENTEEAKDIIKNIEIISFCVNYCLSNITGDFRLESKIKIIQDFYQNSMMKNKLLFIQKQCLSFFQQTTRIKDILIKDVNENSNLDKKENLLRKIETELILDPMTAENVISIQYIINRLYGNTSNIPQDQIDLIDKYLALGNFIISVNQIYNFDFISENEKIEKDERLSIIDKERKRVIALPNPYESQKKELNKLKTKIQELENDFNKKEQLNLIRCQQLEDQLNESSLQLIPLMAQKA